MQSISIKIIILGIFSLIIPSFTPFKQSARAQSTRPGGVKIPPDPPSRRIEETIPRPQKTPLPSTPEFSEPPSLEVPLTDIPKVPTTPSKGQINLKKIEVLGNTVLKNEINQLIKKYENCVNLICSISFEELVQLRSNITQLYIDNGYITSGAFILNNQPLESGILEIQVVEGQLEGIEINGLSRLQKNYVRSRLQLATKTPLNRKRIEEALQLLQLNPLLEQVNAELTAGSTPGQNILQVQLQEAPALNAGIVIDNNQSPTIGSLQGSIFTTYNNLLGVGDQFSAQYGLTEGLDIYDLGYTIPLNARDSTFNIGYSNNNSQIVEDQFADLGIRSDSESLSFGLRQPLVKKPNTEFALGLALDIRRSQTFLLDDIPFSFSEGTEEGESKVTVIRFSQDWLQRNARQVISCAIAI